MANLIFILEKHEYPHEVKQFKKSFREEKINKKAIVVFLFNVSIQIFVNTV